MGVDPRDYIPRLRRYFPGLKFHDPMKRGKPPNPVVIAAGGDGFPVVNVLGGKGEYLYNPPVRPVGTSRSAIERWVKQMNRINNDLDLPPPTRETLHGWLVRYCDGDHSKCCKWVNELVPAPKRRK